MGQDARLRPGGPAGTFVYPRVHAQREVRAVAAHLDNAALREEACLAAVAIAERLGAARTSEVVATMKRVAQLTGDKKLAARAKALIQKAKQ